MPELPDITVSVECLERSIAGVERQAKRIVLVAASLLALACGPSRSPKDPAVQAEARQIWHDRCANCHGPTGNADGPQARHLLVAPRRLSDPAWRATVTDDHLRTVILEGGAAVGQSPVMAANPDLRSRPEVLDALVEHLRGLPAASR